MKGSGQIKTSRLEGKFTRPDQQIKVMSKANNTKPEDL